MKHDLSPFYCAPYVVEYMALPFYYSRAAREPIQIASSLCSVMYRDGCMRPRYFYRGLSVARHRPGRVIDQKVSLKFSGRKERQPSTTFTVNAQGVKQVSVDVEDGAIETGNDPKNLVKVKPPRLSHDLARVLYQPMTLHQLQDPRSGVYNFRPDLEIITPQHLECKSGQAHFVTPHKDATLLALARQFERKYVSSTSSMTSSLSHLHFLLSNFRPLNLVDVPLSRRSCEKSVSYTRGAKQSASFILRKLDDKVTSLDADKSLDREIILSILGHSLEEFLASSSRGKQESYHYSKIDDFILRSQLDAYDPKLPGTGVFDLKTRAVAAIRHDLSFVESNNNYTGYEIDKVYGEFESLEREFFELIRSTMLKYSLQARIGKMDGIFVAYHNIARMFGFQYLPLEDLDHIIHSSYDTRFQAALVARNRSLSHIYGEQSYILQHQRNSRKVASAVADKEFKLSIQVLRNILAHVENQLKLKGVQNWKKCRIMMKTDTLKERTSHSLRRIEIPILKLVAMPLPDSYEDKPLQTKNMDNRTILQQVEAIRESNKRLLETQGDMMVGFHVTISHSYGHAGKKATKIPDFAQVDKKVLDPEHCDYIIKILNKDYYHNFKSFQHPNFFSCKDIPTWRVIAQIYDMETTEELKNFYTSCLVQKLGLLEEQSVIIATNPETPKAVSQRIVNFIEKDNGCKLERHKSEELSDLKSKLRAYAKKGEARRKIKDKFSSQLVKVTWDT